jgi:hypothetical protein
MASGFGIGYTRSKYRTNLVSIKPISLKEGA